MGDMTQVIEESINAHKVVKLFGGQTYERERFGAQANWLRRHQMKQQATAAINVPVVQMVAAIALAVIIYIATVQSKSDETTVGGFLSFIAAMLMLSVKREWITGQSTEMFRWFKRKASLANVQ